MCSLFLYCFKHLSVSKLPRWMACTKHILYGTCWEHPTEWNSHSWRFWHFQSKRLPTWRVLLSRFYHHYDDLSVSLFTGHYEKLPYDAGSMRSIYHIREYCVRKLSLVSYLGGCLSTWIEINISINSSLQIESSSHTTGLNTLNNMVTSKTYSNARAFSEKTLSAARSVLLPSWDF